MRKYLFMLTKAAHSGCYLQETLDVILTVAAFDQQVAILLVDEGIFTINRYQHAARHGVKDVSAIFSALEIYDVRDIYVEVESIQHFGVDTLDESFNYQLINRQDINGLLDTFDVIYSA